MLVSRRVVPGFPPGHRTFRQPGFALTQARTETEDCDGRKISGIKDKSSEVAEKDGKRNETSIRKDAARDEPDSRWQILSWIRQQNPSVKPSGGFR